MAQQGRPNILMIIADDQRFDTISALGNDHIETPYLDSLAEDGCAFTRHHNMGADEMAVCVPARSMIHTSRTLFHLEGPRGTTTNSKELHTGGMSADHPALPKLFADSGYRTFGTGKWHNDIESYDRCFDSGKSVFFGGMGNHWNVPVTDRYPDDDYPEAKPYRGFSGTGSVWPMKKIYDRYESGTHSSELFSGAMIDFLRSHVETSDGRPFFGYMAAMAPHDPRTAPGEYLEKYDHSEIPLPDNFSPEHSFDNGSLDVRDECLEDHPREPEKIQRHIADYYAMITHLDAQIGRILETLEEIGNRQNTIIVFTADHGLALGQHGLMGKQNLYDHSVRVPFLMAGPGVPQNVRRDALTCHYDIYPTLCELAGLTSPETTEGKSLVPTFWDEGCPRESLFFAFEDNQRAVREDRFKLIEYHVEEKRTTQLFDLESDPKETVDLSGEDHHAETLNRLREKLRSWQARLDDPLVSED